MLGAIAGDIIGSVFESSPVKSKQFPLFDDHSTYTDDSVLTVASADALLGGRDFAAAYRSYFRRHPDRGYGYGFRRWAVSDDAEPYHSFGNGSAMRVSPVAWCFHSLDDVLAQARRSAAVSHNHDEGIRGAEAVAAAVFLARTGSSKEQIRRALEQRFGYDLGATLDAIRPAYRFDVTCQGSVPQSIIAFLESTGFEDAVRNAVSLGGDSDTMACMAGAVAEAFYGGVPAGISSEVRIRLAPDLQSVVDAFRDRFMRQIQ